MKKITKFLFFIAFLTTCGYASVANAQATTVPTIDFETVGQDWSWTIFENGDNAATLGAVLANPTKTGINTSANCFRYTVNTDAQPWAGFWSANIGEFTFTASNCVVKLMVHKNLITPMTVKFENSDATVNFEIQHPNTVIDEWELMTFDFTAHIGKTVSKIVLFPDFPSARNGVGSTNFVDNISFNTNVVDGIDKAQANGIKLYPNPVKDQLQIQSEIKMAQVVIRNLLGQTVKSFDVNDSKVGLDLNQLPAGNYLITLKDVNGDLSTRKIVKL